MDRVPYPDIASTSHTPPAATHLTNLSLPNLADGKKEKKEKESKPSASKSSKAKAPKVSGLWWGVCTAATSVGLRSVDFRLALLPPASHNFAQLRTTRPTCMHVGYM